MTRKRKRTFADRSSEQDGLPEARRARADPPSSPPAGVVEHDRIAEVVGEQQPDEDGEQLDQTARGDPGPNTSAIDDPEDADLSGEANDGAETKDCEDEVESESSEEGALSSLEIRRQSKQGYIVQEGPEERPLIATAPIRHSFAPGRHPHLNQAYVATPTTGGYKAYTDVDSFGLILTSEASTVEESSSTGRDEVESSSQRRSSEPTSLVHSTLGEGGPGESVETSHSGTSGSTTNLGADSKKKDKQEESRSKKCSRQRTQSCSAKIPRTRNLKEDDDEEGGDNGRAYVRSQQWIGASSRFIMR